MLVMYLIHITEKRHCGDPTVFCEHFYSETLLILRP